jgi:hypothetical protein
MKKKDYIQPNMSVIMLKQSVALLAGSGSETFKTSLTWGETIEYDGDID